MKLHVNQYLDLLVIIFHCRFGQAVELLGVVCITIYEALPSLGPL